MAAGQPEFENLLSNLLSVDNDIRSKAEAEYEKIVPGLRATYLLNAVNNEALPMQARSLSIVMFRRLLSVEFEQLSTSIGHKALEQMKLTLLQFIKVPTDPVLKRKICDAAAELAKNCIDEEGENKWPEFLTALFDSVNSADPVLKECALNMFAYVPGVFGNQQGRYFDVIKQMLLHCLQPAPGADINVRTAAVKATASFALAHSEEKGIVKQLQETVPLINTLIAETILIDGEHCDSILNSLVELAEKCPQLLRPHFDNLLQLCLGAINGESVPEERKHLALEIIVSLAESASATMRKRGAQHLDIIINHLLQMMARVEDEEEWAIADELEEEDFDSDPVIGETSLDRLACSLGGKTVLPLVVGKISQMLTAQDWRQRHAALMTVSAVGEGCHAQMLPLLSNMVEGVLPFLRDPHYRVRHAACNALGQMATDFSPDFQEKFHTKVIPGLVELLDDRANPRVQAHAGAALVNVFEECKPEITLIYLPFVAPKLDAILKEKLGELSSGRPGSKLVLEQTVVTIAALADSSAENFLPYYDVFVPSLKTIIQNATQDKWRLLRGKSIECVSLIGLAVGKEKFCSDAQDVMNLLLRTQTGEHQLADDDPQMSYMISSWARICKILGPDFEPYLPFVMGPVLKAASIKIEVTLLDRDDVDTVSQDNDWQCVSLGEQQTFGIKTTGLEEKATACAMLVCYARELKHGFVNYVEETVKIMVPLLKFYFHDEVRAAAAESFPHMLESAQVRGNDYMKEVWNFIAPELIKAVETEPEREVICEMISSLAMCIEKVGKQIITVEQIQEIVRVMEGHLTEHFQRAAERGEKRKDEDYDEGVEEILEDEVDEDVYTLSKVADIVHSCFATLGADFLPYFEQGLLNHFRHLAAPDRSWSEHQWAICVYDDLIEHTGPASAKYKELFLPLLRDGLQSSHAEIRQAAAYGFGVLGKFGGEIYGPTVAESLSLLSAMISAADARSDQNINATENAISAVTKILRYNSAQINTNEVLPVWLSWLPVWEDDIEVPEVYDFLLYLAQNNHPLILGENNSNVPRLVAIFCETSARNALDISSEVGQKVVMFLRSLQQNAPLFESCLNSLSNEQKLAAQQMLTQT